MDRKTMPKSLPKVWEYEDPLHDVHGPFDAGQIITWFSQDWFGTDLKIRRLGQYWTQLEYVLEELKAEARGTAVASQGHCSAAPQRAPHGRLPVAGGTAVCNNSCVRSAGAIQLDVQGPDVWTNAAAPQVIGFGTQVTAHTYDAATATNCGDGGSGWQPWVARSSRRDNSITVGRTVATGMGVQLGIDGKWERGHVIGDDMRRSSRSSSRQQGPVLDNVCYQDRETFHNHYGRSSGGRERSDRAGHRGAASERAAKSLQGEVDDEYGTHAVVGHRHFRAAAQSGRASAIPATVGSASVSKVRAAGRSSSNTKSRDGRTAQGTCRDNRKAAMCSGPGLAEQKDEEHVGAAVAKTNADHAATSGAAAIAAEVGHGIAAHVDMQGTSGAHVHEAVALTAPQQAPEPMQAAAAASTSRCADADSMVEQVQNTPALDTTMQAAASVPTAEPEAGVASDARIAISGVQALIAQREEAARVHALALQPRCVVPCSTPPHVTTQPRSPVLEEVTTLAAATKPSSPARQ